MEHGVECSLIPRQAALKAYRSMGVTEYRSKAAPSRKRNQVQKKASVDASGQVNQSNQVLKKIGRATERRRESRERNEA